MILPQQHFRGHVTGRATSLMRVLSFPVPCDSQISNTTISVFIKDDILRFDVAMDDIVVV